MQVRLGIFYNYIFYLLCFSIPFEGIVRIIPNILCGIMLLLFPMVVKKKHVYLLKRKVFLMVILLILTFIVISLFGNASLNSDMFLLKKIALIPVIYVLSIPITDFSKLQLSFVIAVALAIIYSLFLVTVVVISNGDINLSSGKEVEDYFITERLYIGFMTVISFIVSGSLFKEKRLLNIVNRALILLFLLLVGSRIALLLIVLYLLLEFYRNFGLKWFIGANLIGVIFVITIFTFSNTLQERFLHSDKKGGLIERILKWEHRIQIWQCSYETTMTDTDFNFITGFSSFRETKNKLVACYDRIKNDSKKREWYLKQKYNSHNQFIDVFSSTGIWGLILFCALWYYLFRENMIGRIGIYLIGSILLFGMIENFFHRQIGVYLFVIIMVLVSRNSNQSEERKIYNE